MRQFASTGWCTLCLLAAGCATPPPAPKPQTTAVVVPDADGKVGAVIMTTPQGQTVLDRPYASAKVRPGAKPALATLSEREVKETFGAAIAARPKPPVSFTLYFLEGKDEYTPESKTVVEEVLRELASRQAPEIVVIGHTDRVGSLEFNDRLSLQRAERVRGDFIQRGIAPESIRVAGRGEREPLVSTADEMPEPRNRRVEINIR